MAIDLYTDIVISDLFVVVKIQQKIDVHKREVNKLKIQLYPLKFYPAIESHILEKYLIP